MISACLEQPPAVDAYAFTFPAALIGYELSQTKARNDTPLINLWQAPTAHHGL